MTVRRADGVERVYDRIKQMAIEFSFEPGQKVKEGVLAAAFGVSRTPVREAMNRLVTEGFLTFVPNRGFFCRDIDLEEIAELYQIRAALEVWAFRRACADVPSDHLARFCDRWRSDPDAGGFASLDTYDAAFHHAVAGLAGNAMLETIGPVFRKLRICLAITSRGLTAMSMPNRPTMPA